MGAQKQHTSHAAWPSLALRSLGSWRACRTCASAWGGGFRDQQEENSENSRLHYGPGQKFRTAPAKRLTGRAEVAGFAARSLGTLNAGLAGQPVEARRADGARRAVGADGGNDGLDPVRLLRVGSLHVLLHFFDLGAKQMVSPVRRQAAGGGGSPAG